jgi:hypothetical protein
MSSLVKAIADDPEQKCARLRNVRPKRERKAPPAHAETARLFTECDSGKVLAVVPDPPLGAAVGLKLIKDAGMQIRTFCAPMNQPKQRTALPEPVPATGSSTVRAGEL